MKTDKKIARLASQYAVDCFSNNLPKDFYYHDILHTVYVRDAVNALCKELGASEHQRQILTVAAWFHDLGFTQCMDGHEETGANMAEQFLSAHEVDESDIVIVRSCVLSTYYPQKPTTFLEKILCDADLMYLGSDDFLMFSNLLRREWELTKSLRFTDEEWYKLNIRFVSNHHFHTPYCQEITEKGKAQNVELLMELLEPSALLARC